jgi:tetratricopeptide (TPR) repeat protein
MTSSAAISRARLLGEDLGRPQEALAVLAQAIASDPTNAELWVSRARTFQLLRSWQEAIDAARVAIQHSPENERAFRILSGSSRRLGRHRDAVSAGREAVRLAPFFAYGWATLGEALSMRPWSWREGDRAIRRALEIAPNDPAVLSSAASAAMSRRRHRLAERLYRQALAIRPNDAALRNDLALAQSRQFRLHTAILGYGDALAINPRQQISHTNIAASLWRLVLVGFPLVGACAMIASINPRIPAAVLLVIILGWVVRRDAVQLVKTIAAVLRHSHRRLAIFVAGLTICLGWLLVIPFLPSDTGQSQAEIVFGISFWATLLLARGWIGLMVGRKKDA